MTEATRVVRDATLTCPTERTDRCAVPSQLLAAGHQVQRNHAALLERGEDSLLARIHAIRSAKESIELQTFIYVDDEAGSWVYEELLAAARRGVKVRMLLDQLFSPGDSSRMTAWVTAHANLEIKLYNPTFAQADTNIFEFTAGVLCCFFQFNHRMHNKLLVVDDRLAITGGRNIQNKYFDWDDEVNFIDRDVLVLGPEAANMRRSFDEYWDHPITEFAEFMLDVAGQILAGDIDETHLQRTLPEDPSLRAYLEQLNSNDTITQRVNQSIVPHIRPIERLQFYADSPLKIEKKESQRREDMTRRIRQTLAEAKETVYFQTPYLVLTRRARRLFNRIRNDHPEVQVLVSTNSLASTDSFPVYAIAQKQRKQLVKKLGFDIYEMKPRLADYQSLVVPNPMLLRSVNPNDPELPRLSLHLKTIVVDHYVSLIGSHNFDPRSEDLNTEAGLIIWDHDFSDKLQASIHQMVDPANSWIIAPQKQIPIISYFSGLIGTLSRKLPIFDVWPFRYTTSYELRSGKDPVSRDHPDFHEHYRSVGQYPEVTLSLKQIQTRLITAFGGFASPIL